MEKLLVITGTNASGKSGLGIELALKYHAEIVSADSRQVYKGLDLGSGKVTEEEMKGVPHHLLDVAEPGEQFTLVDFQHKAYEAIDDIHSRGKKAFLVGGTGLYINSVVDGYNIKEEKPDKERREAVEAMTSEELTEIIRKENPDALLRLDQKNKRRLEREVERILAGDTAARVNTPRYETLVLGVTWPRDMLYGRIRERLDRRLKEGMVDEVADLRAAGVPDAFLYGLGLEYRYILMYLRNEFSDFDAFYDRLFTEIRHLAKEQMTWFRKRKDIHWIDMTEEPLTQCENIIKEYGSGVFL